MTVASINPSDFFMAPVEQYRDALSFCELNLAALNLWISELPAIQLGDTAQLLLNAIIEVSELNCDADLRFELIQTLHLPVEQLLNSLEKHFLDKLYTTSTHHNHTIEVAQQFRCYLIRIYFDICMQTNDLIHKTNFSIFAFKQKKALLQLRAESTYYALEQLSLLRYQQIILYKNTLIGQWRMSHQLFKLAEEYNFDVQEISLLKTKTESLKNIQNIYKQITLMDVLNTHQIRPVEIHALYQCSFQWVQFIQISRDENSRSRYVIHTENDLPATFNNTHAKKAENLFFVETQALLEHINLANLPNNGRISSIEQHYLSPSLVFHTQHLLNSMPERRYQRYNFSSSIQLTFGLQSAHFYLSHATPFDETLALDSKIKLSQSSAKFLATWNSEISSTAPGYQSLDQETKQIYSCMIMDISINGYRIRWDSTPPKQLRAGEFILVQENEITPWRGGIIRWLKQTHDQQFEFGVEILSQELTPCAVQQNSDRAGALYHPALLIKNEVLNHSNLSIIVPGSQTFKPNKGITLRFAQKQVKIYLTQSKLMSQSFTQLNFELLNGEDQIDIDRYILDHVASLKKQDLWESLK